MRYLKTAALAASVSLGLCGAAHAAGLDYQSGCPAGTEFVPLPNQSMQVYLVIEGAKGLIGFEPGGIFYASKGKPLTPQQFAGYQILLDEYRTAAAARRKVAFGFNPSTRAVELFTVDWKTPC
jgi:hypothetical protein